MRESVFLSDLNASFYNCYIDPAVIDNCCFTQNVCMKNRSIVNLDISGNVSFVLLCKLNSSLQICHYLTGTFHTQI